MHANGGATPGVARHVGPRRDVLFVSCMLALVAGSMMSRSVLGAVGGGGIAQVEDRVLSAGVYRQDLADIEYSLRFERDRDRRINLLYRKGDLATKLGDFSDALKSYDDILTLTPDTDDIDAMQARFYQAEVYGQWGKYAEAIKTYGEIAGRASADGQYAQIATGRVARIRRLESYASRLADEADPAARARIMFDAADLYEKINDTGAAVAEYERFIDQHRGHELAPEAQYRIGQAYARKGMHVEAMAAMQTVVDSYPASRFDSIALFQLGRLYLAREEPDKALAAFDRILEERPAFFKRSEVYYLRAQCLESMGKADDALGAYGLFLRGVLEAGASVSMTDIGYASDREALRASVREKMAALKADTPGDLLATAKRHAATGEHREAVGALRSLTEKHGDTSEATEAVALLPEYETRSHIEWYLAEAGKAADGATRARAQLNAARLLDETLQDYGNAVLLYRRVAEMAPAAEPWTGRALYRLGVLYLSHLGDERRGLDALESLVARTPEGQEAADAYFRMGEVYRAKDAPAQAIRAFQLALQVSSRVVVLDDGQEDSTADLAAFRIARVMFEDQDECLDCVEALRDFVRSRERSPRLAAAWLYLSRVYEELGDLDNATDATRMALNHAESSPIQARWVRYEFPEFTDSSLGSLLDWIRDRATDLETRGAGVTPASHTP
ncbi:tetratricopeptide repeat protein [Candidatus Poribacteria bacterium]|jgi:tetratricopeptide (TPR) repeat protein|nr:tetratricopeptide repeat protein [Candidatus Poribacteria bacterium]MBT5534692.1 tetratricopeptide repeat protein [Candidatus Poribacteria bacterium]MBT5711062.1 tetratricopeptide repeat protein [Candidatus Poribacteria bacterium]MBT7099268.1 tetratricopeptide repeat protein [Candidatus Poribacteria bacterium]MBT7809351.1 tetratricopeptide repeat protein [Candidatus Poribacteria bacterium]